MTEPIELLPCPFCGAPSEVENDFGTTWWVQCHGGQHTDGMLYGSRFEAIAAWNTRTPQPTQAQAGAVDEITIITAPSGYQWIAEPGDVERFSLPGQGHKIVTYVAIHGIKGDQHG